jgi:uncharacterized protein YabE (DUF348 family)/3D (Asp-Asp-Asp) domain-containing protein
MYFLTRHTVEVTDGTQKLKFYSFMNDPAAILENNGVELGQLDYVTSEDDGGLISIDVQRAVNVTVNADGRVFSAEAKAGETVQEFLDREQIPVGFGDSVTPDLSQVCTDGMEITITRGFEVLIMDGTTPVTAKVLDGTVGDLLKRENITLYDEDTVTPPLDTPVSPDLNIKITRVTYTESTEQEEIPFETETKHSNLYSMYHTEEITAGVNGVAEVKKRTRYIDGVPDTSENAVQIMETDVITPPVTRVIMKGAALSAPYSQRDFPEIVLSGGRPVKYKEKIEGKATAYTAPAGSGTASGRKLQIGTVAVDPAIIPYGSLLYIVSKDGRHVYGAAVAADTGDLSDVKVDLYMGTTNEHYNDACNWGANNVDIYVINTGKH